MKNKKTFRVSRCTRVFSVLLALLGAPASADIRPELDKLPDELRGWTDWVLYQEEEKTCPFLSYGHESRHCAWPTALQLRVNDAGGRFHQDWQVYAASWITIPGNDEHWPQDVSLDDRPVAVTRRNGRPVVYLESGRHALSGTFQWSRLPEALPVPKETGLIALEVAGRGVASPDIDDAGRLWLKGRDVARTAEEGDRLKLRVFRRVIDEIPLQLVTRIDLEVSGGQREERLAGVLPGGFIALRLSSRLPARLEPDGLLRVQVRPGRWSLELAGRLPGPTTSLQLHDAPPPWPDEEVWVFDARNHLRLVEIEGPSPVDPRQTGLPQEWRELPAYIMRPGSEMGFNVIRRGDPDPAPDHLSLRRALWLDFNGGGFTIQDHINGTMTRGWRLEAGEGLELGRVSLDGEAQFITALQDAGKPGVEVRRGSLNLSADSRFEAGTGRMPAVGWDHDFQSVRAVLHLPPGWDLFAAGGVDNVPDTWFSRWTLLDIFLVLIAALAVRALWRWPYGLLALATLILIWHEPDAPRAVWLNILAAIALLRVLPAGRFQSIARFYRNAALLALVLIAVPFMVYQVRDALFPQLERAGTLTRAPDIGESAAAPAPEPEPELEADMALSKLARESSARLEEVVVTAQDGKAPEQKRLSQMDPDARVQTGPGLPQWQWKQIALTWNGPVQKEQQLSLTLLSPGMNLVLNLLRVLLVAALAVLMFGFRYTPGRGVHRGGAALLAGALLLPGLALVPGDARAEIPGPELLNELKARLLAPPECLPECAQNPRLRFAITPDQLTLRLEVHALEEVAVPLPARAGDWLPEQVMVGGTPAQGLMRGADGTLWVSLAAGVHQVILRGAPAAVTSFRLPLPLQPRHVEFDAEGWSVEGISEHRVAGGQLQFTRISSGTPDQAAGELQSTELPPFLRVERTLQLGLEWSVQTTVSRVSPRGSAVVTRVPLLHGEAVTTDGVAIEDGAVLVSLAPGENQFAWQSSLAQAGELRLAAPDTTGWTEHWQADVSPVWHLETSGIAVVHHQDRAGRRLPQWRPWPGESVTLSITRPAGVAGRTLTIDSASIQTVPGKRATDTTLELAMRSSQGGQHAVQLPAGAELQSVDINGVAQPIRQEGGSVTLPLAPGEQQVSLRIRSSQGIEAYLQTPAFDLGSPSVSTRIRATLGRDRWVLLLGGPVMGPAVLFWGVLAVVILIAAGLGRVDLTPLKTPHWILLGIGLTQTDIVAAVIIVGWLLAFGARGRLLKPDLHYLRFNLVQIGLGVLTIVALTSLFAAIKHGLLGLPEMQIRGNGSSASNLNWYQDRSDAALPRAWILSVPLWVYRGLMLAWALWLAFALLKWLRWMWECFSSGGLWKSRPRVEKSAGG